MHSEYRQIVRNGLWDNNVVFGQMLALCPLLAVTGTATNGIGMGLATTAVMVVSSALVSLTRGLIPAEVRIPVFVLLIASNVTLVDMFMNAHFHDLYKVLGLFIPLIVTNCAILGRVEAFASRVPVGRAVLDGLMMGLGFTLVLVLLGGVREVVGTGSLFADASLLLGESFALLELDLIAGYEGFLLMILPAGGFVALGFLMAAKRLFDLHRRTHRTVAPAQESPLPAQACVSCSVMCARTAP